MENYQRHLQTAVGYLELGMIEEAAAEVENIAPEDKTRVEVMDFRLDLFCATEKWDGIEAVARHLVENYNWSSKWAIDLARALRRTTGIASAMEALMRAEETFPDCAIIHYNLACYACIEGDLQTTKARLKKAFVLSPDLRLAAMDDTDLEPMWEELGKSEG